MSCKPKIDAAFVFKIKRKLSLVFLPTEHRTVLDLTSLIATLLAAIRVKATMSTIQAAVRNHSLYLLLMISLQVDQQTVLLVVLLVSRML